ncbi:MAG: S8 family serine peptidase [Leptolyngbyaceae cyanobacterium bins.349]|nr:S8 family serine peptidase [Leptolyngbyaceae cyanobacterium bins.349]
MNRQNQLGLTNKELPSKVYAEVIVRSATGASLLRTDQTITHQNVEQFYVPSDRIQAVAQRLRNAGFDVIDETGKFAITVAASPEVYERSFGKKLEAHESPVIKELGQRTTATFINAKDQRPFGEIDVSDTEWSNLLDGVAINEPIYYFQDASPPPSAMPPQTTAAYLSVPDGVAEALNAPLAHREGITGQGVHVVMVDSGFYPHPFYSPYNDKINVVLAPGSTNDRVDEQGHGTGEAANLLTIAPGITFTMVKADIALAGRSRHISSASALRTAIALRPDIISCSWGSDQQTPNLSPANRLLAALVADAVRQDIIMVCAAGNGHYGFPAQHPDVIAAGGVYRYLTGSRRDRLEASNYASSFVSPVYPGRQVPDLCGLVGQLPHACYIMLPVPPGSSLDQRLALTDGTPPTDGWAAFSGTSAAAPQLAGICALIKQVNRQLSPDQVRQILRQTARDVVEGVSNATRAPARAGPDLATGGGLADAYAAVQKARASQSGDCCDACASANQSFSTVQLTQPMRSTMSSQFPKLQKNLGEIQARLDAVIKQAIEDGLVEEVELNITEANFSPRSFQADSMFRQKRLLADIPWKDGDKEKGFDLSQIKKKHIRAAENLIRMQRCQDLAFKVLTAAIDSSDEELAELAIKALGKFDTNKTQGICGHDQQPVLQGSLLFDADTCGDKGRCYQSREYPGFYRFYSYETKKLDPLEDYPSCKTKLGGNPGAC